MKKNMLVTVIFLASLCLQPLIKTNQNLDLDSKTFLEEGLGISQITNNAIITSYEKTEDSTSNMIERNFHFNDTISENIDTLAMNNCEDWNVNGEFNFENLRSEKLLNGDAESTDVLWTDYIPSHYEGNVTRESSPKQGDVISGNNSWYFDIVSQDHTTIVGFDDAITLEGNSVIFSMSYSLLSNSLGTSYDSNICIRLFFQFDIYLFIWFEGNPSVLSNVTGPGGYADLIVEDSSFNGEINDYTLNVTELGLELFDQEPDQLRSLAIQTWGEDSYQMEFMIDDLSLTDQIPPDLISLEVNSQTVSGEVGNGFVQISTIPPQSTINFGIQFTSSSKVFWDCEYFISGWEISESILEYSFQDYDTVSVIESCNESFSIPDNISNVYYEKWVSNEWIIDNVTIDSIDQIYDVSESNSTHSKINVYGPAFSSSFEIDYFATNKISNIILTSNQITHDELLQINIESEIIEDIVEIEIKTPDDEIIYANTTITNQSGSAFLIYKIPSSQIERNNYTVQIFWQDNENFGIGLTWFEIISKPTKLHAEESFHQVEYQQPIVFSIDYQNIEDNITIDFAMVTYNWEFGTDQLTQNLAGQYIVEITQVVSPGVYNFTFIGTKTDFATAFLMISVEVIFSGVNFSVTAPEVAIPGETIQIDSLALNNISNPIQYLDLKFYINNQFLLQTMTNETGAATIHYLIPSNYLYSTLNFSFSVYLNESEILSTSKVIAIEIFDILRSAVIDSPLHINSISEMNSTFFNFKITYPSIGKKWQISLPEGFTPLAATILTADGNITASITQNGLVTWERLLDNMINLSDILLIENPLPIPDYEITENRNEISIEINLQTNSIPYKNLEISILKLDSWSKIENWMLLSNDIDVTTSNKLEISEKYITFIVNSDSESSVTFKLVGTIDSIVTITPSTIVLGIGITSLTVASTFLLFKKKSNVSLDIQL